VEVKEAQKINCGTDSDRQPSEVPQSALGGLVTVKLKRDEAANYERNQQGKEETANPQHDRPTNQPARAAFFAAISR
jgi:hypothetical protein